MVVGDGLLVAVTILGRSFAVLEESPVERVVNAKVVDFIVEDDVEEVVEVDVDKAAAKEHAEETSFLRIEACKTISGLSLQRA